VRDFMNIKLIENKISEIIKKYEIELMGKHPQQVTSNIIRDAIYVRILGHLSRTEQELSCKNQDIELFRKLRAALFESTKDNIRMLVKDIIDAEIIDIYPDVSMKTGEMIIVITFDKNLEELFKQ